MEARAILVVDDDPAVTATLARALGRRGWRVVAVNDPFEALQVLAREPIDLVITDQDMPQLSGDLFLAIVKDDHPDVPCVILTGAPTLESALAAVNGEQVVRYLTKPWTATELEHTVVVGLERRARLLDAAAARRAQRARAVQLAAATDPAVAEIAVAAAAATTGAPHPARIDRYEVLAPLGEGGIGAVYRAVHAALGRSVAIKILRDAHAGDPVIHARFLREARAAVRARHPRIVETLDFGQLPDGRPYLVMELVNAETLRTRLRRGALPPRDAIAVATGIAEALAAAHEVGVVHRDLKPANVFVDELLQPKLADFGAAKLLHEDALTQTGITLGTPSYMSPEHITGAPLDGRSDLYSLGCVLFEMLAGHPPFRGDTARSVLAQHLSAAPPVPASPHGPLPPALVDLVRAAMAKEPAERPADARAVLAALHAAAPDVSG